MTTEDIEFRLKTIAEICGDFEAAHIAEDDLYKDFILSIACSETPELAELKKKAAMVLRAEKIEFSRYYA